jgi:hypothetical protein
MMIDAGLVLYIGLIFLFFWRKIFMWRSCGVWLEYANYCVLLYMLLLVLMVYAVYEFVQLFTTSHHGRDVWHGLQMWVRVLVFGAPICTVASFLCCGVQTIWHIGQLRGYALSPAKEAASLRHDRAIQVIALPGLYSVMAMSSLMRMYQCLTSNLGQDGNALIVPSGGDLRTLDIRPGNTTNAESFMVAQAECCFWVGDLYESWALYQFGKLTLDLIKDSIAVKKYSEVSEQRDAAKAMLSSHVAVEALAWMGIGLFLVVCCVQAGWSLYLLAFTGGLQRANTDWSAYNSRMDQFAAAGMVASAAAIYNIHVVQSNFHTYLQNVNPLLKFITVKIIVTFAFFQRGFVWVLRAFDSTLPGTCQHMIHRVPILGDILHFTEVEFNLFYSALITWEALLITLMHTFAWSANETWYGEDIPEGDKEDGEADAERQPLLAQQEQSPTQTPGS